MNEEFEIMLQTLSPRQWDVIRLSFGIDDGRFRTPEEVGELFGEDSETIKEIIRTSLNKNPLLKKELIKLTEKK